MSSEEIFDKIKDQYTQTCSKAEQLTLALFMETGNYQTHIKKLRKLYSQKLALVIDTLSEEAGDFIEIRNTFSGMNVVLKVNSANPSETLKKEAESLGLPVSVIENDLLIFYYNQLPLADIPDLLGSLAILWRS